MCVKYICLLNLELTVQYVKHISSELIWLRLFQLVLVIMVRIIFPIPNSNFECLESRNLNPSGDSFTAERSAA